MGTPHIKAEKGDFGKIVLMPGDPYRAKWIAETFLTDVKLVNEVRGCLAFTGKTKKGNTISVMSSGMGMPSIGIYSHELFEFFGVEAIIRVGTCGTYQKDINLKDICIAQAACTDSNWMGSHQLNGGTFSAISSYDLLRDAVEVCENNSYPYHVGNMLSSDVFYDIDPNSWKKWERLGVMGVEMESFALFVNAATLGKKALAMCTVSDSFHLSKKMSVEERQEGLVQMIEAAIEVADRFVEKID